MDIVTPEELGEVYNESVKVACVAQGFWSLLEYLLVQLSLRGAKRRGNPLINKTHPNHLSQTILNRLLGRVLQKEGTRTRHAEFISASCITPSSDTSCHLLPPMGRRQFSFGFTLAEVLVTLGIIGVVAALTIPNIITKYQKYVTVNRLKHTYSALSQAIVTSQHENGFITEWDFPADIDMSNDDLYSGIETFANKYLIPYLKISKILGYKNSSYKYYDLNKVPFYMAGYAFTLSDGTLILLQSENLNGISTPQMYLFVDINGYEAPNTMGKDIFVIYLNKSTNQTLKFKGTGFSRDRLTKDCNNSESGRSGHYCGALIQYDGWKIAPDYPW